MEDEVWRTGVWLNMSIIGANKPWGHLDPHFISKNISVVPQQKNNIFEREFSHRWILDPLK